MGRVRVIFPILRYLYLELASLHEELLRVSLVYIFQLNR